MDITNISEDSFLGQFLSLSQLFCGEDKYCSTVFDLLSTQVSNIKTVQGILTEYLHRIALADIKLAVKNQSIIWFKWITNLT